MLQIPNLGGLLLLLFETALLRFSLDLKKKLVGNEVIANFSSGKPQLKG